MNDPSRVRVTGPLVPRATFGVLNTFLYFPGGAVYPQQAFPGWMRAIANPIAPTKVTTAPCQEVVIKGDALRQPNGGLKLLPVPISTPGYDAAPYLTATLCITRDPETGIRHMGTYRAALKATDQLGVRTYAELALVLLLITLVTNIIARFMIRRVSGTALPVGRGL